MVCRFGEKKRRVLRPGEQWESAVLQFHHHSANGGLSLRKIQQLQDDRLVRSEGVAMSEAEEQ